MINLGVGWGFPRSGEKRASSTRENETRCPGCWLPVVNVGRIPLKPVIHLNGMKILIPTA